MRDVYTFILERGQLAEDHKLELITKRGFAEKTIKEFRFISGGAYMASIEEELKSKFKEQDLLSCGIFIYEGGRTRMNPILMREKNSLEGKEVSNIIIPYLDADDRAYGLRPHKLGLKGIPVEVYQEKNVKDKPGEIILTEGEFKAVAGVQYGIPTIAIPGISSFSEANFPRLVEFLKKFGVKRIVIIFDNEEKGDPTIAHRYKDNPTDRYDTQFYAYYMARRLEDAGHEVVIGWMPDAWREDGKIDIDGAVKIGKLRGDMLKVMYDAVPRNDFLRDLPTEAKQVVLRKYAQKRHRSNIRREFNRYVATRTRGKTQWDDVISNFVMKIVATHDTPDGIRREVEFINEFGKHSGSFSIEAESMSSPEKFRTFCMKKGDFSWKGTLDDLMTIWESEFLTMDEGRYILESDHVGWIPAQKCWLFSNVVIGEDGKEVRPDKNGIFWLDKKGIKASSLTISSGKNSSSSSVPHMSIISKIDMEEFKLKLGETIGDAEASIALGWVTAVPFMEEIYEYTSSFPFLFITGRWQSGKSTIADWLMRFFGVETGGLAISQTTAVAIQRSLAYFSSLPVWLDEYRNTKDVVQKNGFLRNAYNRQSSGKGVKADFGLREAKVRGTIMISGEETPKDGALLTRCITIFVSRAKRKANYYNWFVLNKGKFSSHIFDVIKRKEELKPVFFKAFGEWRESFSQKGVDDRLAINYAIVMAGYVVAFGDTDLDFATQLITETQALQAEYREEQAVSVFLDDLMAMKTRNIVGPAYWIVDVDKDNVKKIYLYFHGLHNVWSKEFKQIRGEEAFKEGSIRAYLREEPGFIEAARYKRIKNDNKKCIVFEYDKASEEMRNLVSEGGDGIDHAAIGEDAPERGAAGGKVRADVDGRA